jgi:hypothetical protein
MGECMNKTKIEWCGEFWIAIPGYENYYACENGKILSMRKPEWRILKPITDKKKHPYVFLFRKKEYVHRLILYTFQGLPGPLQECRHLDGNPSNNRISNLKWGTRKENTNDKRIHGTMPNGERSGTHKLAEKDVAEIRKMYGLKSLRELGARFGVSHTAIRRAVLGIKWGHLGG